MVSLLFQRFTKHRALFATLHFSPASDVWIVSTPSGAGLTFNTFVASVPTCSINGEIVTRTYDKFTFEYLILLTVFVDIHIDDGTFPRKRWNRTKHVGIIIHNLRKFITFWISYISQYFLVKMFIIFLYSREIDFRTILFYSTHERKLLNESMLKSSELLQNNYFFP